jgi:lysophospholipase L1-like esterase
MTLSVKNGTLPQLIPSIVQKMGSERVHVINLYTAMGGKSLNENNLFADGVHPNDSGY